MKKTIFLSLLLVFSLSGCINTVSKSKPATTTLSIEEAQAKVTNFINENLMQSGSQASIKEVSDEGYLYKVTVSLPSGQETTSFISKDGKKFFPQAMDIEEVEKQTQARKAQANETQQPKDIPKTDKPKVELFTMSFCPFGVQAENIMAPVVDLLGDKADINIRFIASIQGDDLDSVKSLHGVIEGKEDARQLCVAKNYNEETFWKYLLAINKDCYPIYRQGNDIYNACWKKAVTNAGINVNKINSCLSDEGVELINAENAAANKYGVTGSPTLIINGQRFGGSRTPEGYKTAICNAFNNLPEECSQTLSTEGGGVSGGCN